MPPKLTFSSRRLKCGHKAHVYRLSGPAMSVCTEFVLLPFTHLLRNVSSSWDQKPGLFWDAQLGPSSGKSLSVWCIPFASGVFAFSTSDTGQDQDLGARCTWLINLS